jgi:flagellum-specific peptidoglycan hydrolase FlgJ
MKKFILFLILISFSSCSTFKTVSVGKSSVEEKIKLYIKKFAPAAVKNMRFYKIPASITLAQGVLESGYGEGTLAKKANNHFGIKCHKGWKGRSIRHDDDEKNECFRSYKNPLKSYRDHSLFLVDRDRYSGLFELKRKDYKGWAKGLKAAGYATDPKYAEKLISLIERFNLNRFDE